jgi:toxin HigB-1
MIRSFRHKGLQGLYINNDGRKLPPAMVDRIASILFAIDEAERIESLSSPSLRLHPLKGDLKGYWAITVRANWRIIFRFENGYADDMDFLDYH